MNYLFEKKGEKKITSVSEYIKKSEELLQRFDGKRIYFRGESNYEEPLTPSIAKLGIPKNKKKDEEKNLLSRFRRHTYEHMNRILSPWEALFLARHYELPTRLMDWSTNPLVALYFATYCFDKKEILKKGSLEFQVGEFNNSLEEIEPLLSKLKAPTTQLQSIEEAVNWLNQSIVPFKIIQNSLKGNMRADDIRKLIPKDFENMNDEKMGKFAFTQEGQYLKVAILTYLYPFEIKKDPVVWWFKRKDNAEKDVSVFEDERYYSEPFDVKGVRLIYPFNPTPKMTAQASIFTIHQYPWKDLKSLKTSDYHNNCDIKEGGYFVIEYDKKREIQEALHRLGLNSLTLHLDLPNIVQGLIERLILEYSKQ